MTVFNVIIFVVVHIFLLMLVFAWVMKIRDWVEGTVFEKPARIIIGIPAFAFDWYVNQFACTIMFLNLPEGLWREVVTGRLKRYLKEYEGQTHLKRIQRWRLWWSVYFRNFANKHDIGHFDEPQTR